MDDRRIFARIDAKFPLRFLASLGENEKEAQTTDISANGVGFVTDEQILPNTSLELWLDIPDHNPSFYTRGEVVWSEGLSDTGQHRIGVRLEKAELMGLARAMWVKKS